MVNVTGFNRSARHAVEFGVGLGEGRAATIHAGRQRRAAIAVEAREPDGDGARVGQLCQRTQKNIDGLGPARGTQRRSKMTHYGDDRHFLRAVA